MKTKHPEILVTHCLGHRVELSVKDSVTKSKTKKTDSQLINLYDRVITLFLGAYYFYRKSGKQTEALSKAFKVVKRPMVRPKRVGGTRWVPHLSTAIDALFKGYRAYIFQWSTASQPTREQC